MMIECVSFLFFINNCVCVCVCVCGKKKSVPPPPKSNFLCYLSDRTLDLCVTQSLSISTALYLLSYWGILAIFYFATTRNLYPTGGIRGRGEI